AFVPVRGEKKSPLPTERKGALGFPAEDRAGGTEKVLVLVLEGGRLVVFGRGGLLGVRRVRGVVRGLSRRRVFGEGVGHGAGFAALDAAAGFFQGLFQLLARAEAKEDGVGGLERGRLRVGALADRGDGGLGRADEARDLHVGQLGVFLEQVGVGVGFFCAFRDGGVAGALRVLAGRGRVGV